MQIREPESPLDIISLVLGTVGIILSIYYFFEDRFIYGIILIIFAAILQFIRIGYQFNKYAKEKKGDGGSE